MALFINTHHITVGRGIQTQDPSDDRLYYENEASILQDIAESIPVKWHKGMEIFNIQTLKSYRWTVLSEVPGGSSILPGSEFLYETILDGGRYEELYSNKTYVLALEVISKENIGLGNVDNTSDINKPISNATAVQLASKMNTSEYQASIAANTASSTNNSNRLDALEGTANHILGGLTKIVGATSIGTNSGLLVSANVLSSALYNVTAVIPGVLEVQADCAVMINFSASVELLSANDEVIFTLLRNGGEETNIKTRAIAPTDSQGAPESGNVSMSWALNLDDGDEISISHAGDGFTLYSMQLTIQGFKI